MVPTEVLFLILLYTIRFIIVIIFLIDIIIFFKLQYFYQVLIILFVVLKDFAKNLSNIQSYLVLENNGDNTLTTFKPSQGNDDIDLVYYVYQFIVCSKN